MRSRLNSVGVKLVECVNVGKNVLKILFGSDFFLFGKSYSAELFKIFYKVSVYRHLYHLMSYFSGMGRRSLM